MTPVSDQWQIYTTENPFGRASLVIKYSKKVYSQLFYIFYLPVIYVYPVLEKHIPPFNDLNNFIRNTQNTIQYILFSSLEKSSM